MQIIKPHDRYGWITAIICGRYVVAKVYNEPSTYGIYNGRVSKIAILKTDTRDHNADWFSQCDVNYDRGTDFNNLWRKDRKLFNAIIKELEALPLLDLSKIPEYMGGIGPNQRLVRWNRSQKRK